MHRLFGTVLLFIAIPMSMADQYSDCLGQLLEPCAEGTVLCCANDFEFLYCQWPTNDNPNPSLYGTTECNRNYPFCHPDGDSGFVECQDQADPPHTFRITRVSNTGDVIDQYGNPIYNVFGPNS